MRAFYDCIIFIQEERTILPVHFTVEFNAGVMRALFNVSISNDNILEGSESFNLIIDSSSLPNEVTITNPNQTTVTIVDDDGMLAIVF